MSPALKYTEAELVELLKHKSEEAFGALYDNYSAALFGIVKRIIGDEDAAQDVLQDGFVKIWKNIERYDSDKGTLFTWMLNIVRNKAIDATRSKHYKHQIRLDDSIVDKGDDRQVTQNEEHIGIKEAVRSLKPEHKEVLEVIYFGGYTQEEASKKLDMPLGTLKTRARAAIKNLRELLKDKVSEQ